ncbi:hydroxypyruvate isomerase family protein [Alienimonas californiensis]|uniref:Hydroxypyruvate isomerase n=1 Tax=Alienimonas californiensis TaxID=2527989 RepID=A0A517PC83_9PLAN|nr:TIM barrel protein [Alienimonas californiensis]QDT16985.1 Hydroxypyruvate isomerase [Alienimonas californiensis]
MHRRDLLAASAALAAGSSVAGAASAAVLQDGDVKKDLTKGEPFALDYAPHFGMFRNLAGGGQGDDGLMAELEFMHAAGFRSLEDNGLPNRSPETQEKIGQKLSDLGMRMGVFVAYANFNAPTFARRDDATWDQIVQQVKGSVEIAKRVGAKWVTVVPGSVDQQSKDETTGQWTRYGGARLAEGFQTANVIELLKRCAAELEPHDLVMVLEPLNWYANHGGAFLQRSDQAYALCKAVGSPSCKILFDIYHQQITEGNLIPNMDRAWDEIAYLQIGDNPGRKEPTTGEINYANVFKWVKEKGFEGVCGMEHGNSEGGAEGEKKVIAAYRSVDPA